MTATISFIISLRLDDSLALAFPARGTQNDPDDI